MISQSKDEIRRKLAYFRDVTAPAIKESNSDPIDRNQINDVLQISEYAQAISEHLRHSEFATLASPYYMCRQTDINEKMRAILVDWIIEVHLKFKLLPETLFLTVNLIDRYLEKSVVPRTKL